MAPYMKVSGDLEEKMDMESANMQQHEMCMTENGLEAYAVDRVCKL